MAAYAALVSLMNIMDHIQTHPRISFAFHAKQIESLRERICFLLDFIEANPGGEPEADLECQIACAGHQAEDLIESHAVDQIHATAAGGGAGSIISVLDLQTLTEEMDCIQEKVNKFKQGNSNNQSNDRVIQRIERSMDVTSLTPPKSATAATMIGFDDELIQLMEMLLGRESSRKIIPVHGMGGIGKTTLAKNTYQNPTVVNHFDMRAWVAVSQTYDAKTILLQLLNSCQSSTLDGTNAEAHELGEKLHKILSGRRYLVVLDDVWSVDAWEKIMFFFPDNNNRSRIVVTTRLSNMATYFGSSCLSVNLLDEDKSWSLFCEKAFGKEVFPPPALEKIGKEIAKKCKGLPLSITVIGGLLGKSSMTQEYWESVSEDINSILNSGDDEHCLNILSLSYTHLPVHLKPCFLYMGVFPEDHEIPVSRLIKLWVAEGFLKPSETQSLEEIAKSYVMELVGRNLILARKWGATGKFKVCTVHDLLRDLCLRISEKEKFLHVIDTRNIIPGDVITQHRRLAVNDYRTEDLDVFQSASLVRSLICTRGWRATCKFRLLRVLDDPFDSVDHKILFQQVNIRHLAIPGCAQREIPSSILLFWNLKTLISPGSEFIAPLEFWEMRQLRHLEVHMIYLPDATSVRKHGFVLRNLQTLETVMDLELSEEICRKMANVKRLGLRYTHYFRTGFYFLGYLCQLEKLKRLSLDFWRAPHRLDLLQNFNLPSSLQKLSLQNCCLLWEDVAVIGSLPNLQVLYLYYNSVEGSEWNPIEGQFLGLKYLHISSCESLIRWNAENFHFPVLETLYFEKLYELEEIPLGIGEIPTLQLIQLVDCSESCAVSAYEILKEQESQGNEGLRVRLGFCCEEDMESFIQKVEPRSNNIQLDMNFT